MTSQGGGAGAGVALCLLQKFMQKSAGNPGKKTKITKRGKKRSNNNRKRVGRKQAWGMGQMAPALTVAGVQVQRVD